MKRTFSLLPYDGFMKTVGSSIEKAFILMVSRYQELHQWACDDCLSEGKAILANPSKQFYTFQYPWDSAIPFLAYFDKGYTCESCGEKGILSKEIQQHWYEELQLVVYTRAVRCKNCRKAKNWNTELSNLLKDGKPDDKTSLARIADIYENMGKLEKAKAYRRVAEKSK